MSELPDPRDSLTSLLNAQTITDVEMRTLLSDAAKESAAIVNSYGDNFSSRIRQAQLDIADAQRQMWSAVQQETIVGIGDGVDAASESVNKIMDVYMTSMGFTNENLRWALLAQGRAGIDSYLSRGAAGIPLSQQVYKTSVVSGGQLDRMINGLLVSGASAREIARRVKGFIDPATPGGASYAAMRLGRSELNNAFHGTQKKHFVDSPFVEGVKWNLSRSHPKADICDDYANGTHYRGGDPGVYLPDDVPPKPHPQCFCFLEAVTVDDAEFIKNFHAGQYDSWIDKQLGCSRG